jgi:hypothetical protein
VIKNEFLEIPTNKTNKIPNWADLYLEKVKESGKLFRFIQERLEMFT